MAETSFAALSAAQKKVWSTMVWKQAIDDNYFMQNGFVSTSGNAPIQRVTELTPTERGDRCVMQLVAELEGSGVVDDNKLEDNEEALINDSQEIVVDQLRHAVRSRGAMSEQRTVLKFRTLAKEKLGRWLGQTLDELMHLTLAGRAYSLTTGGATRAVDHQWQQLAFAASVVAASSGRILFGGDGTAEGDLDASDVMSVDLIQRANAFAKRKRITPIRIGGRNHYVLLMSTEQARDLKQSTDYRDFMKNAGPRGDGNVLFKNALAVIDGVILHEHNKTFNTLDLASGSKWGAGGAVDGAQASLMGAQALGFSTVMEPEFIERKDDDYGNKVGIGYKRMFGLLKPQFKSRYDSNTRQDFGVIALKTTAAAS